MRLGHTFLFTGLAFALVVLAGCRDGFAEVKGTVKFNGQLIEEGTIRFESVDQSAPTAGDVIKNGVYSVRVKPGEMKVSFTASKTVGSKPLYGKADGPVMPIKINSLPEKYDDKNTQERFHAQPGRNEKDWELTGP
jgi:hypothetical protein